MIENDRTGPVSTLVWSFSQIAMWAPALIVLIIFYEVVMRYVFLNPTYWVNEMSLWIGGLVYLTSGLYAMQQRSHIRIFILYDVVPLWMRRIFDVLSVLSICIFILAVIWGGYNESVSRFWNWERFGTVFDPPIPAVNKPLILIAMIMLGVQAISNFLRDWPASNGVRKSFDIIATVFLIGLMALFLPGLFDVSETGPQMPMGWRIGIGAVIAVSIVILCTSLLCDFNVIPEPVRESSDPADEIAVDLESADQHPSKISEGR